MQAIAALSMLIVGIVTLVVGMRLLLVGRRTRQLPEIAFGVAFLAGSLGSAGAQLGLRFWWTGADDFAMRMNALCFAIQVIGTFALFLSTWRIFRPNEPWAFGAFAVGSSIVVLSWVMRLTNGDFLAEQIDTAGNATFHITRVVVFAWAAYESFRYQGMLRRRLALGLADPVVIQQIFLWGVSAVAACGISVTIIFSNRRPGRDSADLPVGRLGGRGLRYQRHDHLQQPPTRS